MYAFKHENICICICRASPHSSVSKETACSAGDLGLIPGSGRSPEEGNDSPLQYSCLENFMDREPGGLQSMWLQTVGHD